MSDIICECGHSIERHDGAKCNQCIADGRGWETCTRNYHTVLARHQLKQMTAERDALAKRLEVAIKYIQYDADMTSHITRSSMAKGTLAEIAKMDEMKNE